MPPASARLSNAGRARRQQNTEVMSLGEIPSPNRLDADDTDSVWRAGQAAAPPRRSPGLHGSIIGHFKPKHVQAGPLGLAMKNAIIEFDRPLGRHRKVGDIDAAVAAARRALEMGPWGRMTAVERGSRLLLKLSGTISDRVNEIAAIEKRDAGKPMSMARAEAVAVARSMGAADKVHGEMDLSAIAAYGNAHDFNTPSF